MTSARAVRYGIGTPILNHRKRARCIAGVGFVLSLSSLRCFWSGHAPTVDRRRRLAAFGRTKKVPRLALVRGALISRLFPRYVRIAGPIQGHKEKPDIYTFFLVKNRSMLYVRNSYSPYPFIGVVFLGWNVYYGDAGAHVPSASDSFTSSGCSWRWLLDEC